MKTFGTRLIESVPALIAALCISYVGLRLTDWPLDVDIAFGIFNGIFITTVYDFLMKR